MCVPAYQSKENLFSISKIILLKSLKIKKNQKHRQISKAIKNLNFLKIYVLVLHKINKLKVKELCKQMVRDQNSKNNN
jgi:hypothetical protein